MGPRAGLDRWGKSRPLPGFDPRSLQPIASRYTDYVNRPTDETVVAAKNGKINGGLWDVFKIPSFHDMSILEDYILECLTLHLWWSYCGLKES